MSFKKKRKNICFSFKKKSVIVYALLDYKYVPVSLAQLVSTTHNICKVRDSNPGHQKKKDDIYYFF